MSGSLARLVLRAQGRLPVARPLLPSRYAAAASPTEDVGVEPIAQPSSSAHEPDMPTARPATMLTQRSEPAVPRVPIGTTRGIIGEESPPSPIAEPVATGPAISPKPIMVERVAGEISPRRVPAAPEPARVELPKALDRPDAPSPLTAASAESAEPDLARRPSPGVSPFLAREAAFAAARSARIEAPRPDVSASAMPDVHISIGRVEVHAVPARQAPVRAAPARQSGLSLADYLARRR